VGPSLLHVRRWGTSGFEATASLGGGGVDPVAGGVCLVLQYAPSATRAARRRRAWGEGCPDGLLVQVLKSAAPGVSRLIPLTPEFGIFHPLGGWWWWPEMELLTSGNPWPSAAATMSMTQRAPTSFLKAKPRFTLSSPSYLSQVKTQIYGLGGGGAPALFSYLEASPWFNGGGGRAHRRAAAAGSGSFCLRQSVWAVHVPMILYASLPQ
jgi:hypothetical protein